MDKLGFVEDFSVDGWAFLSRGACKLRIGHCPEARRYQRLQDRSWFAYLHVRDAAGLYAETVKNGVDIWHKLSNKPWGMREFAVVTPDGHRIVFGGRAASLAGCNNRMKNEKLKNPNHALHRVVGNCELGFMRPRTIILGLVVVLILAVVFYKLASPYQSFLRKDFSYYSELAQACAATLDQHPLGNNPFV